MRTPARAFLMLLLLAGLPAREGSLAEETRVTITLIAARETAARLGTLSPEDIRLIFLGKRTLVQTEAVRPVIQEVAATHEAFLAAYVGRSAAQYANYWKIMLFTGKGKAPKAFATQEALIAHVAAHPDAIGYIRGTTLPDTVAAIPVK